MNTTLKIEVPAAIESEYDSYGGIILVDALLNGKKRKFLLDSGAPTMLLNTQHLAEDKLTNGRFQFHGIGGSVQSQQTLVRTFNWHGLKYSNRHVHALNLAHLETQLNARVDGIIGYHELANFSMRIDYKNTMLHLWREFDVEQFKVTAQVPFVMHNHIPVITSKIGKQQFKLGLDTGAAVNLLDLNLLSKVESFKAAKKTEDLHGAGTEVVKVQYGKIPVTSVGEVEFKDMRVVWSDVTMIKQSLGDLDGLLGYEFLKKRQMVISFTDNRIYFVRKKRAINKA